MTLVPCGDIPKEIFPCSVVTDLLLHEGRGLWVERNVRDHINPYWSRFRKFSWEVTPSHGADFVAWLRENYPEEFL